MDAGPNRNTWSFCKVALFQNSGLRIHGKNWKKIEELVPSRTGSQIRSHAQKFFLKSHKISGAPLGDSENGSGEPG
jgi:SHAQKYF class myb-like DNA-binding protein